MSVLLSKMINFTVKPSLERMALLKIAISLWNWEVSAVSRIDLRASEYAIGLEWQKIEDKVLGKVPYLPVPQPLKEKVLCLIKPIGLEIIKWIRYHLENCYLDGILPNDLCWTPQGTIDKMETAKLLTENDNLDITKRYRLACVYCLEDKILQLWERIPSNLRKEIKSMLGNLITRSAFVSFWTHYIHGEMRTIYCFPLMCCLALLKKAQCKSFVNKEAIEYFFSKLSPKKREEIISTFVISLDFKRSFFSPSDENDDHGKYYYFDVLCFLLSLMTEEQQTKFFRKYSFDVLIYFLDWPWQSFFMEMVNRLQNFLSFNDYMFLIVRIINKVDFIGFKDYDYEKLFVELWKQNPDSVKRCCTTQSDYVRKILLINMLEIKDEANIKLILELATITEKKKFIFGSHRIFICKTLINNNEWSLLEFIIRECKISQIEMVKYKEKLTTCTGFQFTEDHKEKWVKFIQLLDDNTYENYKRKRATEGESSSSKRLDSTFESDGLVS